MIPISIDISDTVDEFILTPQEVQDLSKYVLDRVATEIMMRWEIEIDDSLKSTRQEYRKGMFTEAPDANSIILGLSPRQSPLAMMIEDGSAPFDEKEGFSRSDKRKPSYRKGKPTGWYLTIPFRFATAEAIGESTSFSDKMPKPIQDLVKKTEGPLKMSDLHTLPGKFSGLGKNVTSGYNHKNNIFEGLHRVEVGSGTEKRGAYMNFRRVSDLSDPDAWMHPGFTALHLMEKAVEVADISNVVDNAVDEFLKQR